MNKIKKNASSCFKRTIIKVLRLDPHFIMDAFAEDLVSNQSLKMSQPPPKFDTKRRVHRWRCTKTN